MKTPDALRSDHGWMAGWMDGWLDACARACIMDADLAAVWDRVVAKHGLLPLGMEELVSNSWRFADAVWRGYGATGKMTGNTISD